MKILILGKGKSGTTVFLFKVAGGLPNCQAFPGGHPGKYLGDSEIYSKIIKDLKYTLKVAETYSK